MSRKNLYRNDLLPLNGGLNFRDLGGYPTQDGKTVRKGLLFRAGSLAHLSEEDLAALSTLSIRTILDYRDHDEAEKSPDRVWEDSVYICEPAISSALQTAKLTANFKDLLDPSATDKAGPDPKSFQNMMLHLYAELPFANNAYRTLFKILLETSSPQSLVQHCTLGKDRTGVGSALTLLALGVPEETVKQDYLKSQNILQPYGLKILEPFLEKTTSCLSLKEATAHFAPLIDARVEYIETALAAILKNYGSFQAYFLQEFGLGQDELHALRALYVA